MICGINHLTLRVSDLERAEKFYVDVLGLKRVGQRTGMRFYSSGRYAHELALVEDVAYRLEEKSALLHFCFNVETEQALRALYRRCRKAGVLASDGVDHVVMHSFYTRDPDGHVVELGVDTPPTTWRDNPAAFSRDHPLDLGQR